MALPVVVHGHFYQPPREDPRTKRIEVQPSAAPFPDWNERVHAECYRPNTRASILAADGEQVVNNLERMSFNFGPTLMSWLERVHPSTYELVVAADRSSMDAHGHGNALAQAFHHTILPLSDARDIRTQVRWGAADFGYRFGRRPEGMWLPETAASETVLDILIEEMIDFTILAPSQAGEWRAPGGAWASVQDEPIDVRVPHLYSHRDGSGRTLAIFFYDGPLARSIAFENLMSSAESFIGAFASRGDGHDRLVHAATDGETFGHHHKFGDIGLAYALFVEAERRGVCTTNYACFLESHRPEREVRLVGGRGSSWSCAHGVERWYRDCGCSTGGEHGWNQGWREPLRGALDIVRRTADETFERLGAALFADPWGTRDRYVEVVVGEKSMQDFLAREGSRPLSRDEAGLGATLLEMQEASLSMYTSCGWFFSDIGGIETVQVMRYAALVIELLEALGQPSPERDYMMKLEEAKSNDPTLGTGADIHATLVAGRWSSH